MSIRAVVFDYGGVLTTPVGASIAAWLEADRIRPDSLTAVLGEWLDRDAPLGTPVHRLEMGELPVEEFGALLARELRRSGVRTALLSNSWGNTYPADLIAEFAPVVISGEVRLRKPDAAIYRLVLDGLGLPAESWLFIDDNQPNLDGARALGMHVLLHSDAGATRVALAELVPALAGGSDG